MTILYAEVRPRLSGEEAELRVLRFTGCVRDAPQRVRHLHALKRKKKIILMIKSINVLYVNLRILRIFRKNANANEMFNTFKFKFERMREDPV